MLLCIKYNFIIKNNYSKILYENGYTIIILYKRFYNVIKNIYKFSENI